MITKLNFEIGRIDNYMNYVPYIVTLDELYNATTLYKGYDPAQPETYEHCYDQEVYRHFLETGKQTESPLELLSRSIHDFLIKKALNEVVGRYEDKEVIGVMGGHGLSRTDEMYRKIVLISKRLTEDGSLMVTGGGPGAMEATHLGAWMAGRTVEDVDEALAMLKEAPCFKDEQWLKTSFDVMARFPQTEYESLGVPTWLYGHEPATPFATHIAKFFENSIREDIILTIANGGVVFTPGSAGTMQEIFQKAVQNHYLSFGVSSPMVFLGKEFWVDEMPAYTMLQHLMFTGAYKNLLLTVTDDVDEAVQILEDYQLE